jgi:hypothetical protein
MAEGFKDFAPGDILTAADVDDYLMRQAVMRFADGSARTTALSGVLVEGMMSYLKDTNTVEVYDGSAWVGVGGVGAANFTDTETGTYSSGGVNYKYLTFTASGTITIDTAGLADILVVGGGGGSVSFGGGGGGLVQYGSFYLTANTHTVTIGAGGSVGSVGSGSKIIQGSDVIVSSAGGGRGGGTSTDASQVPHSGANGGGGGSTTTSTPVGLAQTGATSLCGLFSGGDGNRTDTTAQRGGGGGGGNAANGGNPTTSVGGSGGAGVASTITGTSVTYGGGGGGKHNTTDGTGGAGGGGDGGSNGTANTGGGGGGGASGGSGVVIVRVEV